VRMAMTSNHDGTAAAADTSLVRPSKTILCALPAAVLQAAYRKEERVFDRIAKTTMGASASWGGINDRCLGITKSNPVAGPLL
jgi:hypothetical protein